MTQRSTSVFLQVLGNRILSESCPALLEPPGLYMVRDPGAQAPFSFPALLVLLFNYRFHKRWRERERHKAWALCKWVQVAWGWLPLPHQMSCGPGEGSYCRDFSSSTAPAASEREMSSLWVSELLGLCRASGSRKAWQRLLLLWPAPLYFISKEILLKVNSLEFICTLQCTARIYHKAVPIFCNILGWMVRRDSKAFWKRTVFELPEC